MTKQAQRRLAGLALRAERLSARFTRRLCMATDDQQERKLTLARGGGLIAFILQCDAGGPMAHLTAIGQPVPIAVKFDEAEQTFPTRGYRLTPEAARELASNLLDAAESIERADRQGADLPGDSLPVGDGRDSS